MELRPLSIGELLDHTFSFYRKNFWLFVGIVAAPQVVMVAVSLFIQSLQVAGPPPAPSDDPMVIFSRFPGMIAGFGVTFLVLMIAATIIYSLVQGAITFALSEVYMGRAATVGAAFRNLRGKVWRLLDTVLSIAVRVIGVYAFIFILVVVGTIVALMGGGRQPSPGLVLLIFAIVIFGMLAAMILGPVIVMRYTLAVPAVIMENLSARRALKRSVALAKGNIWKIFLIILLMYLVSMVVVGIFQGPFLVLSFVFGARHTVPPFWLQALSTISGGIGGTLTAPLMTIALTLLYFDARVRKEGYDLQLMVANLSVENPTLAPATATPPPVTSQP